MENASKALIIAGAILISILLISIGIIIMNSINNPIERARNQSDAQAIEIFNSKFTGYTGVQSASSIKALMTTVASSNGSEETALFVRVDASNMNGGNNNASPGWVQSRVHAQKNYRVELSYGTTGQNNGYVNLITITETTERR